jgi:hypothetical protein
VYVTAPWNGDACALDGVLGKRFGAVSGSRDR